MKTNNPLLGFDKFLMMALIHDGPLNGKQLWEKTVIFLSLIWYEQLPQKDQPFIEKTFFKLAQIRSKIEDERNSKKTGTIKEECEKLMQMGLLKLDKENNYELTPDGEQKAQFFTENMQKKAKSVKKGLFKDTSAARNTTFLDFLLALIKVSTGYLSGSVGLLSDGIDATMDTVSAFLVWLGIKYHHENLSTLLVIFMLFVASISVGFESVSRLWMAFNGTLTSISMPYLVMVVEGLALFGAAFLFFYQRYVGKSTSSLTLISQSVDSKNHIFIAIGVILGAAFSTQGIYYVDAIVGVIVSAGIFIDSVGLLREEISSSKGESEEDYSKYKLPLESYWQENKSLAFQNWILYFLWSKKESWSKDNLSKNRDEIIKSLKTAFHPENYIPVLKELNVTPSQEYDFEGQFRDLVNPLIDEKLIISEKEYYELTDRGKNYLNNFINNFDYYDVHISDTILLAMAEDMKKFS